MTTSSRPLSTQGSSPLSLISTGDVSTSSSVLRHDINSRVFPGRTEETPPDLFTAVPSRRGKPGQKVRRLTNAEHLQWLFFEAKKSFEPPTSGSLCDSHAHYDSYAGVGFSALDFARHLSENNIEFTVYAPIPTTVKSKSDKEYFLNKCDCCIAYYIPPRKIMDFVIQDKEEFTGENLLTAKTQDRYRAPTKEEFDAITADLHLVVRTDVDDKTASFIRCLHSEVRRKVDPMATGFYLSDLRNIQYFLQLLTRQPLIFSGIGEVTVHKEVVDELLDPMCKPGLVPNTEPREALKNLIRLTGVIGVPFLMHCDITSLGVQEGWDQTATAEERKNGKYFANLLKLFEETPKCPIIWAHGGGKGRFITGDMVENQPRHQGERLTELQHIKNLDNMLSDSKYNHVSIDISWYDVAVKMNKKHCVQEWAALIKKHPTRFLFGSDALTPNSNDNYNNTREAHESLFKSIADDKFSESAKTLDALMSGNYKSIFLAARERMRMFELYVLQDVGLQKKMDLSSATRPIKVEAVEETAKRIFAALAYTENEDHQTVIDKQGYPKLSNYAKYILRQQTEQIESIGHKLEYPMIHPHEDLEVIRSIINAYRPPLPRSASYADVVKLHRKPSDGSEISLSSGLQPTLNPLSPFHPLSQGNTVAPNGGASRTQSTPLPRTNCQQSKMRRGPSHQQSTTNVQTDLKRTDANGFIKVMPKRRNHYR